MKPSLSIKISWLVSIGLGIALLLVFVTPSLTREGGNGNDQQGGGSADPPVRHGGSEYSVLVDGKIAPGTGLGVSVDDDKHLSNWLSEGADYLKLEYPGNLSWAAVFFTVGGSAVPPPRPFEDFSSYNRLRVEMRGETGGECVGVGVKDFDDPDDGTEPKKPISLEGDWKVYEIEMSFFKTRNPGRSPLVVEKLYLVSELAFPCRATRNGQQTVYVRNIEFVR